MQKLGWLGVLSAMALGQVCHAGIEVYVRDRNGSTTPVQLTGAVATGNHVTVTPAAISALTGNSAATEWIVWVFDSASTTGAPTESIGSITIDASGGDFSSKIRLLVAPAPGGTQSQSDFDVDPSENMFPGAVNLGPVTVTPAFAHIVALAAAVTGDIGSSTASPRDQISVGQIYRLQASGLTVGGTLTGGHIYADITATALEAIRKPRNRSC